MGCRTDVFLEKIHQLLNSGECAETETPKAPPAGYQSCSKDIAILKSPCVNKNGTLLHYEAFLLIDKSWAALSTSNIFMARK